jgi:uncharacterized protein with NRDE domain
MCTLVVALRHFAGSPLVVAANRDERYARPSSPIGPWAGEPFVAPRDDAAGGTWLGLNASGVFVGVTNRFGVPKDELRESRGTLVVEALRARSARELHAALATLSPARFNAFHLLYADVHDAFVTWSDGSSLGQQELGAGTHVVTERSLGGDDRARTELLRERLLALDVTRPPEPDAIQALMRIHGSTHPLAGTCIHVPEIGYGTKSSAVLFVAERLGDSRLFWAEGSPCTVAFEDRSSLVTALASLASRTRDS